jgi:hypothetical protein
MTQTALSLGGWLALLGGIWFLFDKSEAVASQETKLTIRRWLQIAGSPSSEHSANWQQTFGRLFDHVFGQRHLTWHCFLRSCGASLCATAIVGIAWIALTRPSSGGLLALAYAFPWILPVIASTTVGVNLIADYFSLLKTRLVIRWMGQTESPAALTALLAADLIATPCIAVAGFLGTFLIMRPLTMAIFSEPPTMSLGDFLRHVVLLGDMLTVRLLMLEPGETSKSWAFASEFVLPSTPWFCVAFFTSAWAWLYALSGTAVKLVRRLRVGVWVVSQVLDVEGKPIASIGWVAMLIATGVYWTVFLAHWR